MGNVVPTGGKSVNARDLLSRGVSPYTFQEELGTGRFLNCVKCRSEDGAIVVVKIYQDPNPRRAVSLKPFEEELAWIRTHFSPYTHPNLLPYQRFFYAPPPAPSRSSSSTFPKTAFLVRQYVANNLYDRLSTHPFLSRVEKLWISYQLLQALYQCHSIGICHGDVKSENIMVTSWDWLLLTDFAPHKPTFLPSDEPAQFNYFFATSKRRCCCVAPERFCSNDTIKAKQAPTLTKSTVHFLQGMMDHSNSPQAMEASLDAQQQQQRNGAGGQGEASAISTRSYLPMLKASMDIFSAGCVIAELFADGAPCFDLSQLLHFARNGEPTPHLIKVLDGMVDPDLKEMLASMLAVKPDERGSAEAYLKCPLFPRYFPFMFRFAREMLYKASADERIWAICENYDIILREVANGYTDTQGHYVFRKRYETWRENHPNGQPLNPQADGPASKHDQNEPVHPRAGSFPSSTAAPAPSASASASRSTTTPTAQELIEETAEFLRNLEQLQGETHRPQTDIDLLIMDAKRMLERQTLNMAPSSSVGEEEAKGGEDVGEESGGEAEEMVCSEGMILPIALVCATLRFVEYPSTKVTSLGLLEKFAKHVDDSIRLQRIVPYVVSCLSDSAANVRCVALRLLTSLLEQIHSFPPSDAKLFQEFLLPGLHRLLFYNCQQTKVAFFECMPRLAAASRRFLEISTTMSLRSGDPVEDKGSGGSGSSSSKGKGGKGKGKGKEKESYDEHLAVLRKEFDKHMRKTTHEPAHVKRSLLFDVGRLCLFFGHEDGCVDVLGVLITFLNEREDWQVLGTFFDAAVGMSALVGPVALEKYLLPCIEQALHDREEMVVHKAVHCLKSIVLLGLVHTVKMIQIIGKVAPLLYHPGAWVRTEVMHLIAAILATPGLSAIDIQIRLLPFLKPFLKQIDAGSLLLLSDKANSKANHLRLLQQLVRMPVPRDKFKQTLREMDLKRADAPTDGHGAVDMNLDMTLDMKLKAMGAYLASVVNETKSTTRRSGRSRRHGSRRSKADLYYLLIPHQAYVPYFMAQNNTQITSMTSHLNPYARGIDPNVGVLQAKYGIQLQLQLRGLPQEAHPARQLASSGDGGEALSGGVSRLQRRIRSLNLPPLPPEMGTLRRLDGTSWSLGLPNGQWDGAGLNGEDTAGNGAGMGYGDSSRRKAQEDGGEWRPKGVLMATLHEHNQAVNRICVSQDQLFFATGSSDGTVRLWLTPGLERTTFPRSALTYASQGGAITDLCMIDNTHSIASASDRGTVHVFAIEHAYTACKPLLQNTTAFLSDANVYHTKNLNGVSNVEPNEQVGVTQSTRSIGSSTVLEIDSLNEGPVRLVEHFNTATQSLLVFATERCVIHGWDLRRKTEAFKLRMGPQGGLITSMVVAPDGGCAWMAIGTSRGVVGLWDLRLGVLVKAWRHSKGARIHHMTVPKGDGNSSCVYIAAGKNEFCQWDLETGSCVRKFKTISVGSSHTKAMSFPKLTPVNVKHLLPLDACPQDQSGHIWDAIGAKELSSQFGQSEPSVRALLTPAFTSSNTKGKSKTIISAGSDCNIRFWDMERTRTHCYTISGIDHGQLNALWDKRDGGNDKQPTVLICEEQNKPKVPEVQKSKEPKVPYNYAAFGDKHGPVPPSSAHTDCIYDLQCVDIPNSNASYLISAGRDGVVKVWR